MNRRIASATETAMKHHAEGHSIRVAAKMAGVAPSTLFRALKRVKEDAKTNQPKGKK